MAIGRTNSTQYQVAVTPTAMRKLLSMSDKFNLGSNLVLYLMQ